MKNFFILKIIIFFFFFFFFYLLVKNMFFQTMREKKFKVNEIGEKYLRDL
jgi:hypothetical protein